MKLTPRDYRSGSRVMLSSQDFKHLGRDWSILVWPWWCWRKKDRLVPPTESTELQRLLDDGGNWFWNIPRDVCVLRVRSLASQSGNKTDYSYSWNSTLFLNIVFYQKHTTKLYTTVLWDSHFGLVPGTKCGPIPVSLVGLEIVVSLPFTGPLQYVGKL